MLRFGIGGLKHAHATDSDAVKILEPGYFTAHIREARPKSLTLTNPESASDPFVNEWYMKNCAMTGPMAESSMAAPLAPRSRSFNIALTADTSTPGHADGGTQIENCVADAGKYPGKGSMAGKNATHWAFCETREARNCPRHPIHASEIPQAKLQRLTAGHGPHDWDGKAKRSSPHIRVSRTVPVLF